LDNLGETFGLARCTNCLACTQVCPFGPSMERPPAAIVQHALAQPWQTSLAWRDIWLCSSCGACTRSCPVDIDVEAFLEALRREAVIAGQGIGNIARYQRLFVTQARRFGRLREGRILLMMRFRRGTPFPRRGLSLALLVKGKWGKLFGRSPKERP